MSTSSRSSFRSSISSIVKAITPARSTSTKSQRCQKIRTSDIRLVKDSLVESPEILEGEWESEKDAMRRAWSPVGQQNEERLSRIMWWTLEVETALENGWEAE